MSTLRDALTTHEKFLTNQIATLESERQRVREQLEKLPQEPTRLMDFFREHQTEVEALTKEQEAIQEQSQPKLPTLKADALSREFRDRYDYDFWHEFRVMGMYFRHLMSRYPDSYLRVPLKLKCLFLHTPRIASQKIENWADAMVVGTSYEDNTYLEPHTALEVLMSVLTEGETRYTGILHGLIIEPEDSGVFKVTYREDS
jgi:hypothetical protein